LYSYARSVNAVRAGRSALGYPGRWVLQTEARRAADEGISALVEAQQAAGGLGDTNSHADAQSDVFRESRGLAAPWRDQFGEPERSGFTEIDTVEASINLQGGSQPAGTACEVEEASRFSANFHLLYAFDGFERANEDASADARQFGGHVEHEMIAVGEIHVRMTPVEKHGAIARSWSAKVMCGGIARRIRLGLDDASAEPSLGEFADDDLANEKPRQGHRGDGQFGASKPTEQKVRDGLPHNALRLSLEGAEIKS
jgi:hypothetical protein